MIDFKSNSSVSTTFNHWLKPIDESYLAEYGGSAGRIGQSGNSRTNT